MKKIIAASLLFLSSGFEASAQEWLTLSRAMEEALKNNFFINIARNDSSVAANDNSWGNAGALPTVDASAGISTAINNTEQRFNNGNVINQDGATTDNLNAAVRLNWTLFDGMRMFAVKSRLNANQEMVAWQLKSEIENTLSELITAYFNVVRLQQSLRVIEETIRLNDERVEIAKTRFEVGSASKLDYLQARVDRDARMSEMLRLRNELQDAVATVNLLSGFTEFREFYASDSITFGYMPQLNDIYNTFPFANAEMQMGRSQIKISEQQIHEYRAWRYPWLSANAGYSYSRNENEVGFSLFNRNQGLQAGLTLSWNLFNGFNTGRQIKNAKIQRSTSALMLDATRASISQQIAVAYRKYESDKAIVILEESGLAFARENADISLEAYRLGSISGIQLREAQNSYELALNRLIDARYQAKLSETGLMKLNGDLIR
jgi:outer membrane protein TolC